MVPMRCTHFCKKTRLRRKLRYNILMPCPLFYVHSERGGTHAENEDAAFAVPHSTDASLLLCTLADGQGGRSGGKQAAEIGAQFVLSRAGSLRASRLRGRLARNPWPQLLSGADEAVSEASENGFTTLIGLAAWETGICGASCGDSGVLLVRANGETEWLTQNQRKNPPVGSRAAFPVGFSFRAEPGDVLLIMSDGVFRYVDEAALCAACQKQTGSDVAALRDAQTGQNRNTLPDDFSVIVVRF